MNQGDTSFSVGDIINVIEKIDNDWWRGVNQVTGIEGLFPSAYIEPLGNGAAPVPPSAASQSHDPPPSPANASEPAIGTCVSTFDYMDGEADDLKFDVGETIEILEKIDANWWRGRIGGRTGMFPSAYVQEN